MKQDLISKGLIIIELDQNKKKIIKLTKKGLEIFDKLVEINELINSYNKNKS